MSNRYTIQPNDHQNIRVDAPINSTYNYENRNGNGNQYDHGIILRDRLTDIFAYYPSDEFVYNGFIDPDCGDPNPGEEYGYEDNTKQNKKLVQKIMRTMQQTNLNPGETEFIYSELLNSQSLIVINKFKTNLTQPWSTMKAYHIDPLEARHNCKLVSIKSKMTKEEKKIKRRIERRLQRMYRNETTQLYNFSNCAHPLTDYRFYLKRILDHKIEIPDRFDISNASPYSMNSSYLPIKLMARYYRRKSSSPSLKRKIVNTDDLIDTMGITLLDLHSVRSKTMFALHISKPSKRDGITVADQISYSLNTTMYSANLSQYLIYYGTTTDYRVYQIHNPLRAMIYHISFALLEPEMKRGVFYSPRHILDTIEIMAEYTEEIKQTILQVSNLTEEDLLAHILDDIETDTDNDDNNNDNNDDNDLSHTNKKSVQRKDPILLERITHVFDVLYCIKEGYTKNRNIISECLSDLWPKLTMFALL
jgi:hypothetical protein